MKKFISIALVLAMAFTMVVMATGCGGSGDGTKDVTVVISTSTGDGSFNDSAKAGQEQLQKDGFNTAFVECNTNADLYEQNLRSAAETSKVVVAVGSEFSMIEDVVKDFSEVKFIWVDNVAEHVADLDNLICVSYSQNEGSYLVGYAAAKYSKSKVVGIVGGQNIDVINDFIIGYKQGAEAGGAKVVSNYTNDPTWSDTEIGSQCAIDLAKKGADVIFQACGGCGIGVIQSAKDNGYMAIGVDCDQRVTLPDYADYILCSMVKEVGNSIVDLVSNYINDEKWEGGQVFKAGLEGNYISVAYGSDDQDKLLSQDIMDDIAAQQAKIQSGEIKVNSVFK